MKEVVLCYQGEMALKGLNKATFESALAKALRYRVRQLGQFQVYKAQSTMYIEPRDARAEANVPAAFERARQVFGLAALSRAAVCEKDFEAIKATAEAYLGPRLEQVKTFKVEAKRSDKSFPMKSPELCRELGGFLLSKHPRLKVDVRDPELLVMVEVRDYGAYIHGPKEPGPGGLPVGTSGRAVNLLSGGIDSPVAAWYMARRGLALHHIHFASPPYTSEGAKRKVAKLARIVSGYTGSCVLYVIPYTKPQEYLRDHAPEALFTVLMRRSMMRIANRIAKEIDAKALITGESLAQVASQTLMAIACTDAAQDLPVLRPLIGMDKTEIVERARQIGTFETSILPYEDCCTIFTPPHPKTKPTLGEVEDAERAMPDLPALEEAAAAAVERIRIDQNQADEPEDELF